jgi:hypothetical protein
LIILMAWSLSEEVFQVSIKSVNTTNLLFLFNKFKNQNSNIKNNVSFSAHTHSQNAEIHIVNKNKLRSA